MSRILTRAFFERPFLTVAEDLIGATLQWNGCGGRIVEVEAYAVEGDAACHTATRASSREFVRTRPPGTAYVYLNYGVHWLLNVLAGDGIILFRALEPRLGIPLMQQRRGREKLADLCSGPGKLGAALALTGRDHGADLSCGVFTGRSPRERVKFASSVRIGISQAIDLPWRFVEQNSAFVSGRRRLPG